MRLVTEQIKRLAYRSQFYLDVPGLVQLMKFKQLRQDFYRELWQQAATAVEAEYADWGFGFARISKGGWSTFVKHGSVMLDDHLSLDIAGNKLMVYHLMAELGYRVPKHRHFQMADFGSCETFFDGCSSPVVVKPASGTGGGRGVTTGITTRSDLRKAARLAASFDTDLIVEEQLQGGSFRLLYFNGQFVDAVRRDPPVIIGDGKRTIRQLVSQENKRRLKGDSFVALSPLKIDRDCQNKLREDGVTVRSCLELDRIFELKQAVNENCSLRNHNVTNEVHPDTISSGAQLVNKLGIKFAGLDVMCRDISNPLGQENGLITEINTTPGIHHHYLVSDKTKKCPVAELVLDYMFSAHQGVMHLGDVAPPELNKAQLPKAQFTKSAGIAA